MTAKLFGDYECLTMRAFLLYSDYTKEEIYDLTGCIDADDVECIEDWMVSVHTSLKDKVDKPVLIDVIDGIGKLYDVVNNYVALSYSCKKQPYQDI